MTEGATRICDHLCVVGGGRMGEAIVAGLLKSGSVSADAVTVVEPSADRRNTLSATYGVSTAESAGAVVSSAEVIIIAVKPQVVETALTEFAGDLSGALVVSIAAGVTSARIESLCPAGTAVVRVMPNTPAMVGEGMSVVSPGSEATDTQVDLVSRMFESLGRVVVLDERYQDVATAVSGSGPAYVALFVDALARAGVMHGLPRDVAQLLALQTLRGTVELIERTGQHPEQIADSVASPGGTTIAAIDALERGGFRSAIADAVSAAVRRAKELGAS